MHFLKTNKLLVMAAMVLIFSFPEKDSMAQQFPSHLKSANADERMNALDANAPSTGFPETRHDLSFPMNVTRDVVYGKSSLQHFDIYTPQQAKNAPVIFMVHGGAWVMGDKANQAVVQNKMTHWLSNGFIFISTNYRLVPAVDPVTQAEDIAQALATAQEKIQAYGGDPYKFILMGHSAGAHLVALLNASPSIKVQYHVKPWLGSVLLDSAALNLEQIMQMKPPRVYERAFGRDSKYWRSASPFHLLNQVVPPLLVVCSTMRSDSCPQAHAFVSKASSLGTRATVLEQGLSHKDINVRLGKDPRYTKAVDAFLATLDPAIAKALQDLPSQ